MTHIYVGRIWKKSHFDGTGQATYGPMDGACMILHIDKGPKEKIRGSRIDEVYFRFEENCEEASNGLHHGDSVMSPSYVWETRNALDFWTD